MAKITFEYDKDGRLMSYKDGKPNGYITGMGDMVGSKKKSKKPDKARKR